MRHFHVPTVVIDGLPAGKVAIPVGNLRQFVDATDRTAADPFGLDERGEPDQALEWLARFATSCGLAGRHLEVYTVLPKHVR